MTDTQNYEVAVVGGGPAGLTAALYTTRLGHETAVIDRGGGRAAMMRETHNVIGVPESVSGKEFLQTARDQVEGYGAEFHRTTVTDLTIDREDPRRFHLATPANSIAADRVVLATGFSDGRPDPPLPRTGRGLHYCLHCDAYMFVDEPVYVMGHGDAAARVAMLMLNFTDEVDLLTREEEPTWSEETARLLEAHPVNVIDAEVADVVNGEEGWLSAIEFADGTVREYRGGFGMYGAEYNNDLAAGVGAEINDDGTVAIDDHGRTSVEGLLAVGDLTPGHKQIPVAMGEGAKAGIACHYALREFPRSLADIEESGPVEPDAAPAISDRLRAVAADHAGRAGHESAPGDD
jgi:thioredoxin reductase (NADPH)